MLLRPIILTVVISVLGVGAGSRHALARSFPPTPEKWNTQEADADAATRIFDFEYEWDETEASSGEPDFYRIFRKSIRKRVGNTHVNVVPKVDYGIVFKGPSNYHEGERTPFPPASTNKIFTASLALSELGGDYVYDTRLTWVKSETANTAGYLTFVASGDPSFMNSDLTSAAAEYADGLLAAGVKNLYGPLRISATDPRWDIRVVPDGWKASDLESADGFIPNALGTLIESRVNSALRAEFSARGIHWQIAVTPSFGERDGIPGFASHFSRPLRELIQPFVLHSINFMGEAFLRKVGELKGSRSASNLHVAGLEVLREFVAKMLGPDGGFDQVVLNDGSGLSRTSRVTAAVLVRFLETVKSEPYFADFFAALPTAGKTGTLDTRMSGTSAEDRIHAKTGTLDGNYQLAGYLVESKKTGEEYHPFSILTGTVRANAGYCRMVEDEALASLATWMLKTGGPR